MKCSNCLRIVVLIGCLLGSVVSCKEVKKQTEYVPEVSVSKPEVRDVTEYLYFTGNTKSPQSVEFRARVSGVLTGVYFKDGDFVKAGDVLFEIEPETYESRWRLSQAAVTGAEGELMRANLEYQRQVDLAKSSAASISDVDRWRAQKVTAQAKLDEAKASEKIASIQYSYTKIIAPFDGRMDRVFVDKGNLVGVGDATLLSVIRKTDPMYAYFPINEKDLAYARKVRRQLKESLKDVDESLVPIELEVEGESGYPNQGVLDFGATSVDEKTGSLLLRGSFVNPTTATGPKLLPGMFVRTRIPLQLRKGAFLVPERVVGTDQQRRFVYVVDGAGIVGMKTVEVGHLVGEMRVILSGVQPDDMVITNGIQRVQPGAKVTTKAQR